jgi:hypothetical protein
MAVDTKAKLRALSEILEGRIVTDTNRVEICVKGTMLGFPATLEALRATFPFGVSYFVETNLAGDGANNQPDASALNITIMPRYAKGILSFITRILLFESKGQLIGDKSFDSRYISSFNDTAQAERLLAYPGISDKINELYHLTSFNELLIRVGAGLYLSQPKSFNSLNLDVAKETFRTLAEIGQVLFEDFDDARQRI